MTVIGVGDRVMLRGVRPGFRGPANRGVVVNAFAPGLRTVRWDDGTKQELPVGELVLSNDLDES